MQETWILFEGQEDPLENSIDRGAWQATVHGVAKSWTRLSDYHFTSGKCKVFCFFFNQRTSLIVKLTFVITSWLVLSQKHDPDPTH